ncbi:MAG: MFS transporter [Chloroflexi bacterium]|nr:MFS transporter [Chloroflexota bacterium]
MNRLLTGLWRHPDFLKLWVGQSISEFGTRISRTAIPLIAVILLGASPAQMGVLTALGSAPVLLFGLFAGVWVDRLPRRPVMIAMDLGRLLLLLSIPITALTGTLSMALLYIVVPLQGIMSLIFYTAYHAYLPSLINRADLVEGNSKLATTESLAEIGGPSVAGLLIQWISAPLSVVFDAISYLFSSISFLLIRQPEPPRAERPAGSSALTEIREGLAVIAGNPILRVLIISVGVRTFFGNFYGALYDIYAIRDLGMTPAVLGLVVSAGGIGALIGSLLADRVQKRLGLGRTITVMLLISGLNNLLIPLAVYAGTLAPVVMIVAQIIGDGAILIFFINDTSLRQIIVPDRLLGRTNATFGFLAQGIAPVGALVAGTVAASVGAQPVLWLAGFGILGIAVWVSRSTVRQLEHYGEVQAVE